MRTYKLTIAYDGSRYQGWQRQSNTDKTVQGLLEQAASETAGYPLEVQGSGRTDGGVHAKGQTASVILRGKVQESEFLQNMNRLLPYPGDRNGTGKERVSRETQCSWKML